MASITNAVLPSHCRLAVLANTRDPFYALRLALSLSVNYESFSERSSHWSEGPDIAAGIHQDAKILDCYIASRSR